VRYSLVSAKDEIKTSVTATKHSLAKTHSTETVDEKFAEHFTKYNSTTCCEMKVKNELQLNGVEWSPDGHFLAVGFRNGHVKIFDSKMNEVYFIDTKEPLQQIIWRQHTKNSSAKYVLLVANEKGQIGHYHVTSKKLVSSIRTEAVINSIDYSTASDLFCCGLADYSVEDVRWKNKTINSLLPSRSRDWRWSQQPRFLREICSN